MKERLGIKAKSNETVKNLFNHLMLFWDFQIRSDEPRKVTEVKKSYLKKPD